MTLIGLATLFIVGVTVIAVGIVTFRRALRGRLLDEHPICGRCGFDLFGLPPGHAACPECGADLLAEKAIRIGHRRARPVMVGLSVLIILLPMGIGFVVAVRVMRNFDIQDYKPVWWLLSEAKASDVPTRDAALAELQQRLSANQLSAGNLKGIAAAALAHQANTLQPWDKRWGALVEDGRRAGLVDDATWTRYLSQIPVMTAKLRPVLRRGDTLPFEVRPTEYRCADATRFRLNFWASQLQVDRVRLTCNADGSSPQQMHLGPSTAMPHRWRFDAPVRSLEKIADGHFTARMSVTAGVYEAADVTPVESGARTPYPPPRAYAKQVIDCPLDIVSGDSETVTLVDDPQLCAAMEKALVLGVQTNAGLSFQAIAASTVPSPRRFAQRVRQLGALTTWCFARADRNTKQ